MHGRVAAMSAIRGRGHCRSRPVRAAVRTPGGGRTGDAAAVAGPQACGEPCGRPACRSHGRPSEAARSARLHRSTAARSAPGRWTSAPNPARTRDAPSRHLRSLNSQTLDGMNVHAHDSRAERLFHWLELAMRLLVVNVNTTTSMTDQIIAQARSVATPGTQIVGLTPSIGVGSGPLPGRGQGTTATPPPQNGSNATKQPNPHEPARTPWASQPGDPGAGDQHGDRHGARQHHRA
jgi:hypothetical protein